MAVGSRYCCRLSISYCTQVLFAEYMRISILQANLCPTINMKTAPPSGPYPCCQPHWSFLSWNLSSIHSVLQCAAAALRTKFSFLYV